MDVASCPTSKTLMNRDKNEIHGYLASKFVLLKIYFIYPSKKSCNNSVNARLVNLWISALKIEILLNIWVNINFYS